MTMHAAIEFIEGKIVVPPLELPSREIGASLDFLGIVRELEGGVPRPGLHYHAHESMARKHLLKHIHELEKIYSCESVHFVHRLGWVPVEEASLFVRVLSAHRGDALGFLGDLIDRLKRDVPIWKGVAGPKS